eukprot:maker-scaffold512_size150869-snap-gene-0.25 protein:Tk03336 transcript:maker-scaffold512_size150869-snap-gene-0.25-mRNA-1 annotation:"4-hydroxyacetophenone monooxygenase"
MVARLSRWLWDMATSPWLILTLVLASQFPEYLVVRLALALALYYVIHSFAILEAPIFQADRLKVIIAGAGISGLGMAQKLKEVGIHDFLVLEKAANLGGTWWDNVYPGVACDITSHFYSYSYYMNPKWSKAYSGGTEIWNYLNRFAEDFGIRPHIRFGVEVTETHWDDQTQLWTVHTKSGEKLEANVYISAVGALHVPNRPTFQGEVEFVKPIVHTAKWDKSLDLKGLRVAIIGTGATSVQVVPAIADDVKALYVFQRTAAWVPDRNNFAVPNWVQELFVKLPFILRLYRNFHYLMNEATFYLVFNVYSPLRGVAMKVVSYGMTRHFKSQSNKEALTEALIPKFNMGCKRITPSDDFLDSFNKPHVHLIQEHIERFTSDGIRTQKGRDIELDAIILATGYSILESTRAFKGYGKAGKCLQDYWGECPRAYLGLAYPGFPNAFVILGPGTGLGHSSIVFMIECQINYVVDCLRKLQASGKKSMDVKRSTLDEFVNWLDTNMKNMVFGSGCLAWYRNSEGVNWTLWPSDLTSYWRRTYSCDTGDYIFE